MQLPAHLANRQRRDLASQVATGLAGLTPPYVSINAGQFTLVNASGDAVPLGSLTLDCVILDTLNLVSRVFWGVNEQNRKNVPEPGNPVPPLCFSDNGVGASANAQEPQSATCAGCRWNQWGSAVSNRTGQGIKACDSLKKIAVMVAQDPRHPWLLRVPVMSHDNLAKYAHSFAGQQFDVTDLWTRITIVPQQGAGYALTFEPSFKYDQSKGFVDEQVAKLTDGWVQARMTDQVIGRGDPPWTGQLAGARASQEALQAPTTAAALPSPRPAAPSAPAGFQMPAAPPAQQAVQQPHQPGPTFPQAPAAPAQTPTQQRRRRATQPPAAEPGNGAPRQAPFGIASGPAAPPPSEMEAALAKAFGLPGK
jgi:hypothetical protein